MSAPINIYGKGHTFVVCFQSEDQVTELFMKIDSSSDGEINWVFSHVFMLTQQTAIQISAAVKTLNSKNIHNAVLAMVFQ